MRLMKKNILIIILIYIQIVICYSQNKEFTIYDNGLIYSDTTIANLNYIVDSLNLKYKRCDITHNFMSKSQAKGNFITLNGIDLRQAKADLDNNISFNDFINKYPNTITDKELLVLKTIYTNYENKQIVEFYTLPFGSAYNKSEHSVRFEDSIATYHMKFKNKWIVNYYEGNSYYPEQAILAFYISDEFKSVPLKNEYANLIQYVDCIIDTNTTVFSKQLDYKITSIDEIDSLMSFIDLKSNIPDKFKKTKRVPFTDRKEYERYLSLRDSMVENELLKLPKFQFLLSNAVDKALKYHIPNEDLEVLAEKYVSQEKALQLLRNRRVIGECSGDLKPRQHTMKIATLAAETQNWNVFIRAHLDIMNDRFERMSDNSWSASKRQTYISELESLNLNVVDLLIGMCFQIENASRNHYFVNVGKIGKALIESNNLDYLENKIVSIVNDETLDDNNRILFYFLYDWYSHSLKDEDRKQKNLLRLSDCIENMPDYVKVRLQSENYELEQVLKDEFHLLREYFYVSETCIGECGHTYRDEIYPNSWSADLQDKNHPKNVLTNIIIGFENKPMSVKPFIEQKDNYYNNIKTIKFIFDTITATPNYKIEMWYVNGYTMPLLAQEKFLKSMPKKLKSKYAKDLDRVILFEYRKPSSISNWLYFPNGDIMLWDYQFDIPVYGYEEKQLVSDTRKYSGYETRTCYKLFDTNGKMK